MSPIGASHETTDSKTLTMELNLDTRVPENPGNPSIFKPIKLGLKAVENPSLMGLI